jgi:hypothetical protein
VIVTGLQPDVGPYFDGVKLSVAPLRYGAGVKGKINQSMGFGVPVVATSIAVEGMSLTDHEDALVADAPQDFARAVVELYTSQSLWDRISQAGLEKTRSLYSREAAEKQLRRLLSDSGENRGTMSRPAPVEDSPEHAWQRARELLGIDRRREVDDATWQPTVYDRISEWGHHPPQFLAPTGCASPSRCARWPTCSCAWAIASARRPRSIAPRRSPCLGDGRP